MMTPWQWVRRALATALILVFCAMVLGGGLGALNASLGLVVGGGLVMLAGAAWAVGRIGGAGLGAALVAGTAGLGMAIEVHHFRVVRGDLVEVSSLEKWTPGMGSVLHVRRRLTHVSQWRADASRTSTSGKSSTSIQRRAAVPLVEDADGPIVGFKIGRAHV
jgi:hypothetical protein